MVREKESVTEREREFEQYVQRKREERDSVLERCVERKRERILAR